jgi:hypothetical protein
VVLGVGRLAVLAAFLRSTERAGQPPPQRVPAQQHQPETHAGERDHRAGLDDAAERAFVRQLHDEPGQHHQHAEHQSAGARHDKDDKYTPPAGTNLIGTHPCTLASEIAPPQAICPAARVTT